MTDDTILQPIDQNHRVEFSTQNEYAKERDKVFEQ
jgi:hypothetical protein